MNTIPMLGLMLALGAGRMPIAHAQEAEKTAAVKPDDPAKIAPDIQAKALWDGRKVVPFKALDYPKMVKASEADFLTDEDYVLGVQLNGESRAYPTRFAWFHHVINDKVVTNKVGEGEKAEYFAVTYCSVCNTGIAYDPVVNGKPRLLEFYGLYNGVVTLCDRETETVLLQMDGRMVKGPLMGITLKTRPILDTTWKRWRELHPDTLVMSPETPFQQGYRKKGDPEPRGYTKFPAPFFQPTVTRHDKRLPPFDKVLAVALAETMAPDTKPTDGKEPSSLLYRAYPVKTLEEKSGVINDMLGTAPVVALCELDTVTASAFSRKLDGKTLTFESRQKDGKTAFFDKETGSRWSIEGKAEEGPLKNKQLESLNSHLSQWYGWVAYFPQTTIYGRTDPSKTEEGFAGAEELKPPQ